MRFPLVTSFFIASAIFIGCAYVGDSAARVISYRRSESKAFDFPGTENAQELRTTLQTLAFLSQSRLVTQHEPAKANYQSVLERNIPYLQKLRDKAPERLRPPIDLQIAVDYAEMAHLEQEANRPEEANKERRAAQALLSSLGWKVVSPGALDALAVREIQPLQTSESER